MTAVYKIAKRPKDRVLVDYNQNAWGRTLASVYSVRPRPHATVSTPVTWKEVEERVSDRGLHDCGTCRRASRKSAISGSRSAARRAAGSSSRACCDAADRISRIRRPRRSRSRRSRAGRAGPTSRSGTGSAASRSATATRSTLQSKAGKPLTRYFPEMRRGGRGDHGAAVHPRRRDRDPGGRGDVVRRPAAAHPSREEPRREARARDAGRADRLRSARGGRRLAWSRQPFADRRARLEAFVRAHVPADARVKLSPSTPRLRGRRGVARGARPRRSTA